MSPQSISIDTIAGGFIESFAMLVILIVYARQDLTCCFSLYGIAVSQGYVYFRSGNRDPLWIKLIAGSVLYVQPLRCQHSMANSWSTSFLETVHTAFFLRMMYFYTVLAIENPLNLGVVDW